jgi:hypothetical protein
MSRTIKQIVSYEPVSDLLEEELVRLNKNGCKIISIHETKVNGGLGCSNQGFIIIYDTNEED